MKQRIRTIGFSLFVLIRCYVPKKVRQEIFLKDFEDNGLYYRYMRSLTLRANQKIIVKLKPYLDKLVTIHTSVPTSSYLEDRYLLTINDDAPYQLKKLFKNETYQVSRQFSLLSESLINNFVQKANETAYIEDMLMRLNSFIYTQDYNRHYTIRNCGTVTFTPKGKPTILGSNNSWARDNRQATKLGKAFRKWFSQNELPIPYSDSEIEHIHNKIMQDYIFSGKISEVDGADIKSAYHVSNYARNAGTLNGSCMKYDECQDFIDFYAFTDGIRLIQAVNDVGKVIGRAVVWNNARFGTKDGKSFNATFCDRVYGSPLTTTKILDYAKSQGYITKEHQNYGDTHTFSMPNGESITATIRFQFAPYTAALPYMDTFKTGGLVTALSGDYMVISNDHEFDYELTDTSGNYIGKERKWSEWHDRYLDDNEAVYSAYLNDYILEEYAVWSDYHDSHLPSDDVTYSDLDNDYYHYDERTNNYITPSGRDEITMEDTIIGYIHGSRDNICPAHERTVFVPQHDCHMYESHTTTITDTQTNDDGESITKTYYADADNPYTLTYDELLNLD